MAIKDDNITATTPGIERISVIIVTYNAAEHLQKCLDSIYKQAYPAIDIIIVDGKSTDGTVQILEQNTGRIHFCLSEKDSGIYDAMNKAIKHISGSWVYFLGADDELLPDFSLMAQELKEPDTIYYGNVLANGIKRSGLISPYYMAKGGIYHQAIIYPKTVFDKYTYNTKYKIAADYALNMSLYKDKRYKFVYLDYIICNYNHLGISGRVVDEAFEQDKTGLILKNFELKIGMRYLFRLLKAGLGVGKKE
ncbi:glycosyltransferase family 2 protein [Mucilaginibacter sp. X5P1]|uniref:glycosyltransferase family 2 protein n=1 Tax=Mucilaginibacter sp. X5P1 TaxID=2723088 RepID=UPI00160B7DA4|nr:glycosyltransferase family 2 protein [Mucilaginibacter sp. X5P1]MBB6139075.1 glycosyltransferase involved in cell wall biosynthesis [Mucilaginibacter sp. X5P1]